MKIDPTMISVTALGVSALSLLLSTYRAATDRRLQWEQSRGAAQARLTARALEIVTLIEEVRGSVAAGAGELASKLIQVAQGLTEIRESLKRMQIPPRFKAATLISSFAPIKSDLDDADPVFERLRAEVRQSNFGGASQTADGLLQRLYGSQNKRN
jgi:hypothetical protein